MATGTYGIVRPADVTPDDVEIFYTFTPSRDRQGSPLTKLDSNEVLIKLDNPNKGQSNVTGFEIFGGMYTLKLPVAQFGVKGFYTIIIKPVEIRTRIVDCGVLSAYPDVRGLVFDLATVPSNFLNRFENNGLIGYRIEYLNPNTGAGEAKLNNFFRIITSNNRAEPVNQNLTNSNQKAIRYRFNDNSTLTFCTVSPNSAANVRPNALPFIGNPNQQVIITNTFFNPIMLEVEMVQHDIETLAFALFGNQTKSLEDGIYTIYNFNNDIYKQYNLYEIKDKFTGKPLFEVREERSSIDFTKTFTNITTI
jgi:hypothetical protein